MGEEINYSETTNLAEKENIFSFFHLTASQSVLHKGHTRACRHHLARMSCSTALQLRGKLKLDLNRKHQQKSVITRLPLHLVRFSSFFRARGIVKTYFRIQSCIIGRGPPDSQSEEDTFASHGILNKLRRKSSLTMRKSSVRGAIFKVNGGETRQSERKMWILILNNYGRWVGPGWVKK